MSDDELDYIAEPLRDHAVRVDNVSKDPSNVREHPEKNKEAVKSSLREFGQRQVLVAREEQRTIEAGNLRLECARELGWSHVAVIFVDDDDLEAARYAIADNRTTDLGEWSDDDLGDMLEALDEPPPGYTDEDVGEVLDELKEGQPYDLDSADDGLEAEIDRAAELQKEWGTEQGQLWQICNHRLLVGDCRERNDVDRLLGDISINVAFTSPPYAEQRDYDEESGFEGIPPSEYVDWFEAVQGNVARYLADDGSWFVNIKGHSEGGQRVLYVRDLVTSHARRWGWRFVDEFAWLRPGVPGHPMKMGRKFKNGFEPVFHFAKNKHKMNPDAVKVRGQTFQYDALRTTDSMVGADGREGGKRAETKDGLTFPSNVLDIKDVSRLQEHAAAFPAKLPSFFVKAYTDSEDAVYDPFVGSGTTIVAAENNDRRGFGMELSPKYAAVSLQRLADMGLEPELVD